MRWSGTLRRPVVAIQFGIGVVYTAAAGYEGNPMAIGNDADNKPNASAGGGGEGRRRSGRRGRGGPGGGPMAPGGFPGGAPMPPGGIPGGGFPGGPGGPMGIGGPMGFGGEGAGAQSGGRGDLNYYTGELGTSLLEKLEERILDGTFGEMQKSLDLTVSGNGAAGNPMANDAAGAAAGIGLPGDPAGVGAPPGAEGGGAPGNGGAQGIAIGVTFLGEASDDALAKKAKEQGIDVLILFDVKVQRSGKTGIVRNTTKIKVTLVSKPQDPPLATSAQLVNVEVAAERDKENPVDAEIDKIVAALEKVKVTDMPSLAADVVQRRITSLTSSPSDSRLLTLVEVKYYHASGLIDDQQFADAAKALLGDKAQALLKTKEEERREALVQLLPKKPRR